VVEVVVLLGLLVVLVEALEATLPTSVDQRLHYPLVLITRLLLGPEALGLELQQEV
jgi:hypothetical protein